MEGKKYASVETAYDTMSKSFGKKKINNFEYILIILLILLSFTLLREYKILWKILFFIEFLASWSAIWFPYECSSLFFVRQRAIWKPQDHWECQVSVLSLVNYLW